ncbi:MAG: UvrD-helicase domain-containing protein [Gammaproteobacteria bacterium]|nr:UvrD-helicase domain-containing protein [Gammaproteobacteria bacterium]
MNRAGTVPDQAVRERALTPDESFIVQAPAGSGKTELLIQRFLRLLATVTEPEQVVAVTFTRKAAGEMRRRVVEALRQAASGVPPQAPHLRRSYDLARAVLADPQRADWQLQRHPARLDIGTIDGLNASLVARAPLTAASAVAPTIAADPDRLYEEAARATLAQLAGNDAQAACVATLLTHIDLDAARFERLLVAMLPRREQWLRHVVAGSTDRGEREAALAELVEQSLAPAAAAIDAPLAMKLTALLAYAADQCRGIDDARDLVAAWGGRQQFPQPVAADLPAWKALADLLLTAGDKGAWRKQVNVRNGFPPGTPQKKDMEALLKSLAGDEQLRTALCTIRLLPEARYADQQWAALGALIEVLRLAAGELHLVFAARGEVDFPEVAAAARMALGTEDQPSETRLALDQRIRHFLVDEFQDTSAAQFDLLQQLTSDWQPGDGRTLFLVGDPMQSIYRFRQAEVSLFMHVRDRGLGALRPAFLQLTANFRSLPALVEWNNRSFSVLFPFRDDPVAGAVASSASIPVRGAGVAGGVTCHWLRAGDLQAEAMRVLELVQEAGRQHGHAGTCILVRSRNHATTIIAALREAGVPFVAGQMEYMARSDVAQDLLALTRALLDPGDRLAWIGVLRSPLCGLSLADLTRLLAGDHDRSVPDLLGAGARDTSLSVAGRYAIGRLVEVLGRVAGMQGRIGVRDLVEAAWLGLGGPATLREPAELETARTCLEIVESLGNDRMGFDPVAVGPEFERHKASLGGAGPGVQLMTVHEAKGLEFETVIVPALARRVRASDPPPLRWHELTAGDRLHEPILAPIGTTGAGVDPLYRFLRHLNQQKDRLETARLLYVACTRARHALHLVAGLTPTIVRKTQEIVAQQPQSGSLLEHLWPAVAAEANAAVQGMDLAPHAAGRDSVWIQPLIRRLPPDWQPPPWPLPVARAEAGAGEGEAVLPYEWVGDWAREAGVVVHQWLQRLAEPGTALPEPAAIAAYDGDFRRRLHQLGTAPTDLDRAVARVRQALMATLSDPTGRWLLSDSHEEARTEWALTVVHGDGFRHLVIDRSFLVGGTRWIVDYKTTSHEGGEIAAFLEAQAARHAPQLCAYREAVSALDAAPVRTALYFPLVRAFVEVDADGRRVPAA